MASYRHVLTISHATHLATASALADSPAISPTNHLLQEECKGVVSGILQAFMKSYLGEAQRKNRRDPLDMVTEELLLEVRGVRMGGGWKMQLCAKECSPPAASISVLRHQVSLELTKSSVTEVVADMVEEFMFQGHFEVHPLAHTVFLVPAVTLTPVITCLCALPIPAAVLFAGRVVRPALPGDG
jgi:hypothetical protein